ncbi:hypothetical protein Tco_1131579 [Tanacetum coccineum]
MMHKMKEGYGDGELTLYPTQVFSVNNWALKPNQPEEPPFTNHMLDICVVDTPMVFKAPKTSSKAESVYQGTKPGAKPRHKKLSTSSKQHAVSNKKATKGRSSKAPTSSKTGHSKKRKDSSSAMDSNPSQPLVSTPVDTEIHKEDQQVTGGPTFRGNDASTLSTTEADPGKSAPSDFVPQQQGMNKGTKNTSYDHLFVGNEASSIAKQLQRSDSPEDDPVIVMDDSDEDEDDEVHATENVETKDTLVSKSSSPRLSPSLTSQVAELKTLEWEMPAEFLVVSSQVDMVQAKLKTLDALPSQAGTQPAEEEKNTNQAIIS